jgi:Lysylphosphatidylglycerol synthase TM region
VTSNRGGGLKRIRIDRQRTRRERPWHEVLSLDSRDPDVVRAKTLARASRRGQPVAAAGRIPARNRGAAVQLHELACRSRRTRHRVRARRATVPWHGLLLAYTASQLAGSLIPLPGGLGSADGGLLGALTLTGTPLAAAAVAAVISRLLGYWAVGAAATCVITAMRRRHPVADITHPAWR